MRMSDNKLKALYAAAKKMGRNKNNSYGNGKHHPLQG